MSFKALVIYFILSCVIAQMFLLCTTYTHEEGHASIAKRFGCTETQVEVKLSLGGTTRCIKGDYDYHSANTLQAQHDIKMYAHRPYYYAIAMLLILGGSLFGATRL